MTHLLDPDCALPPHLLELFLRAAPGQLEQLAAACQARSVESARALSHKLKGALYAAGASRLAESVEQLRVALSKGDFSLADRLLLVVRDDFAQIVLELEKQLRRAGP